jgi:hypothetical protein
MLHFTGILPRIALYNDGSRKDGTAYDYIISDYFGSFHYSFIFATDHNDSEQEYGALGHVQLVFFRLHLVLHACVQTFGTMG